MNTDSNLGGGTCPFKIGDVLVSSNPFALARKIRVAVVTHAYIKADVLEGENKREPLTVLRAGWGLYGRQPNRN